MVSSPNSVTLLKRMPIFEWCVVGCGSKNRHHKGMCLKGDWTMSSKFVNPCRLNSQHNWGPLCDHVMRKKDLHFDNELDIDMMSKFRRKMATGMKWIC